MEQIGGGGAPFRCYNHNKRSSPSAERFLGVLQPQSSSATPPLELSEDDIFSTPSGSPSPTNRNLHPKPSPNRNINRNHHGILAALNGNTKKAGIGSDIRPVFNRKASIAASLSSSSSTSPATSVSSRIMIPRPPPQQAERERVRMHPQSAPVNIPVMPESLRRRARDLEDLSDEEEEEEEDNDGVILPPHEVVASRHSLMLSCSVMEGAGRTLKGRDLRQVRNAVWRKTGLLD